MWDIANGTSGVHAILWIAINPLFQQIEPLHFPPTTPIEHRTELVHEELYREIKRKLYSARKDDTATSVEIRIDQTQLRN